MTDRITYARDVDFDVGSGEIECDDRGVSISLYGGDGRQTVAATLCWADFDELADIVATFRRTRLVAEKPAIATAAE